MSQPQIMYYGFKSMAGKACVALSVASVLFMATAPDTGVHMVTDRSGSPHSKE